MREFDGTVTWTFRELGGVEGALAARADAILASATQRRRSATSWRVFSCGWCSRARVLPIHADAYPPELIWSTEIGRGGTSTTQAPSRRTADDDGHDEASGAATVEVAHEALIRAWPTFGRWINEFARICGSNFSSKRR